MTAAGGDTLEAIDIMRLMEYLPHRYPFLMIDRIVGMRRDDFGIGIKNVTFNEPHFAGHFPNFPVMPGVLLIEGMAQTGGALCIAARPELAGQAVYFMTIDKAKFRKPVMPGDVVEHHMTKLRNRGTIWRYKGESFVAGTLVAEAEVTAMIGNGIND
jgi:3-hydroxyacyl-[acyl-carrier-protein] dehydratase